MVNTKIKTKVKQYKKEITALKDKLKKQNIQGATVFEEATEYLRIFEK